MFLAPTHMLLILVLSVVVSNHVSDALPTFADRIPNGKQVPNPGPQGGIWAGVGHLKAGGGGELNPFGKAFAASGYEWTVELCALDSDGDGRTNGQELGDPDCVWVAGNDADEPSLSHPGIVDEPQDSPAVKSCSNYVEPESAIEYEIKFSQPVSVDSTRTHYVCEQMDQPVPSTELLQQIKNGVLLDNSDILHHIFAFVCPSGSSDGDRVGQGPYQCGGNESKCQRIAGWAVGAGEYCFPPNIGEELDFTETSNVVVKVEAHYDNVLGIPQQDQSGMRLTFTPELRALNSRTAILGMSSRDNQFELPPLQASYSLANICPSEATARLPHPIFAYRFAPHMHLVGRSLFTEHYRCGKKIGEIGRIEAYEFDNQQSYVLDPPIKILPGDALVTTCQYNTLGSTTPIAGGEGTTDEMCLNFIGTYPGTEDGVLGACLSFSEGISGILDESAGSAVAAAAASLQKFAVSGGRGSAGILLQYETDPTKSWSPCCDDDTCDGFLLGEAGAACALDADCVGELVCGDGVCDAAGSSTTSWSSFPSCTLGLTLLMLVTILI